MTKSRETKCQIRTVLQKSNNLFILFFSAIFTNFKNAFVSSLMARDARGSAVNRGLYRR